MYSVYSDGMCIFSDICNDKSLVLIDPVLTLEDNLAGSLTFTIPTGNPGYTSVKKMTSEIVVKKDDEELWSGRVMDEDEDFLRRRRIVCEGELAYLNDSTQPPTEYHDITVRGFLERLIAVHNSKVGQDKQFTVGIVTVNDSNDSLYRYTNYESTLECVNEKLVERLGGHLRIRKENGVRYIDYLADYPNTSTQVIRFGENLLDFARSYDMSDFATVIVPLGAALDESPIEALTAYVNVSSVNNGSIYVTSSTAVEAYGWIEKVVHFDDVEVPSNLLRKAREYLNEVQYEKMTLQVSALDLHYVDVDCDAINLLDEVRVTSPPHGLNRLFPVSKLTIPLDRPEETAFDLGTEVKKTFTQSSVSANQSIINRINSIEPPSSILQQARDNASQLIHNATNGYITILTEDGHTQEILISSEPDYTEASRIWRWNINGLGYSSTGYNGTYGLALTRDGAINADRITTGQMTADHIRGGTLVLGGIDNNDGLYVLKNGEGKPTILMNNTGMVSVSPSKYYMKINTDGQITGGKYTGNIGNDYVDEMFDSSNYTQYGFIDVAAEGIDGANGNAPLYGIRMRTDYFAINAGRVAVRTGKSNYPSGTPLGDSNGMGLFTVENASIPYVKEIHNNSGGGFGWTEGTLRVVNGMIVSY